MQSELFNIFEILYEFIFYMREYLRVFNVYNVTCGTLQISQTRGNARAFS